MDKQEVMKNTVRVIEGFFADEDWTYEYEEEKMVFRTGVNLDNKLKSTRIFIRVAEQGVSVLSTINMKADKECLQQVAEYLTRANYGLRDGNFELDFSDGEIRYKVFHSSIDGVPSKELIKNAVYIGLWMLERYGNGLLSVMFGMQTPAEAIEESEKDN